MATHPLSRTRALTAAAVLALLALAGCSSADNTPMSGPAGAPAPAMEEDESKFYPESGADGGAVAVDPAQRNAPAAAVAPVEERSIVYTGTVTVRVESVVDAADEATAVVIGLGGFVAGDTRTIDEERSQATLVLRVPADTFTATLDTLAHLGTEQSRQVNADDVTETLVDLDARIATQQASLARVRELLARATTIGEIVALENELTNRQAELDSLTQRRETMAGLVALATITVVLYGPTGPVVDPEPDTGFLAGLRGGWDGFLSSVTVVLTVAGWLLPWAIAIGVPLLIALWIVRRRRRQTHEAAPPAES
jgi:hypothetical protein